MLLAEEENKPYLEMPSIIKCAVILFIHSRTPKGGSVEVWECISNFITHFIGHGITCLVHPGVRDKRRVSEIDLSQPRHETAFWWRHNGPVTSQLTDPNKWPSYLSELIGNHVHIHTNNKESMTQRCRRSTNVQLCLIFLYISIWIES